MRTVPCSEQPLFGQAGLRFQAVSLLSAGSAGASVWPHPNAPAVACSSPHSGHRKANTHLWALRLAMGWPRGWEIFLWLTANTTRVNNFITAADGYWSIWDKLYLSVQGLLACQLIFQLVFDVVERGRLPLGTEIPTCNTNHVTYSFKSCWSEEISKTYRMMVLGNQDWTPLL